MALFLTTINALFLWMKERHENKQKTPELRAKSYSTQRFVITLAGFACTGLFVYFGDVEKRKQATDAETKAAKNQTELKSQLDVLTSAILNPPKANPRTDTLPTTAGKSRVVHEKQPDYPIENLSNETLRVLVNTTALKMEEKYRELMLGEVHFEDLLAFAKDDAERKRLLQEREQLDKRFPVDNAQLFADADLLRRAMLKRVGPLSPDNEKLFNGPISSQILYGLLCRIVDCKTNV